MITFTLQILQVFDSCAGELGPDAFQEFSLPYLKDIAYRTKEKLQECHVEPVPMVNDLLCHSMIFCCTCSAVLIKSFSYFIHTYRVAVFR